MPANYVLLQRIELNASAASVTFSNIPQSGYTDLKIVMSTRAADSANNWYLTKVQFNTDTTSGNYSSRIVAGFGSTAFSGTNTFYAGYVPSGARTANTFGNNEIYIPNYTGSTAKSFSVDSVTEGNGTSFEILGLWAGLWSGTAAINQIVLSPDTGSWAANSTFSLYGLAATGTTPVIAPKATGGSITSDGTYWIHTFTSTGTFTPLQGLSCDYLVVAGGGSGGGGSGGVGSGGGGAGGYRSGTLTGLTASTNYTVTVGAGGASVNTNITGNNGSNSVFSTITSAGGGGGGTYVGTGNNSPGLAGGSGGGGGTYTGTSPTALGGAGNTPSTSPSQGNNGGNGGTGDSSPYRGGGGGGAGAVGVIASTSGNGGAGTASSITGTSVTYAGGGGAGANSVAGAGGSGGGGAGAAGGGSNATAGTVNTGGGGGGAAGISGNSGAGGSGIVVIRYAIA